VRRCIWLGSLSLLPPIIILMQLPRRDAGESMFALPLTRYPGRCQAASRPDRIFSASETYVTCTGTCGLTVGTNLSSDMSPLRSIGSGHSQNYRRSRRPVHNRLNYRGSRRSTNQHYLRWQSNVPMYTCHEYSVAVTTGAQPGPSFLVPSYLLSSPIRPSSVVYRSSSSLIGSLDHASDIASSN
jgi:hypothetical protein